jgi:hypothetical protein
MVAFLLGCLILASVATRQTAGLLECSALVNRVELFGDVKQSLVLSGPISNKWIYLSVVDCSAIDTGQNLDRRSKNIPAPSKNFK